MTDIESHQLANLLTDLEAVLSSICAGEIDLIQADERIGLLSAGALSTSAGAVYALEVERHCAQLRLLAAIDLGGSPAASQSRYQAAEKLGFRDFNHRSTVALLFLHAALPTGSQLAVSELGKLMSDIETVPDAARSVQQRQTLRTCRRLKRELADTRERASDG
jgi:hypothetical protein